MWPYGVLWILAILALTLTVYQRVKSHLEHRKRMADIRQMREGEKV